MLQLLTGIIASSVHVITGPDHLAAVTPLALENKHKAWHVGFFWGIGHVIGMLLIGLLYFAFRELIPVDKISFYSEYLVGAVLIGIGTWALIRSGMNIHSHHKHPHLHTQPFPYIHIHAHRHQDEFNHQHQHTGVSRQNNITAIMVGTLHGFAGISHFLLILPTLTLPSRYDSILYVAGFGAGTILTMVIYALILGLVAVRSTSSPNPRLFARIRAVAGIVAILIGIYWILKGLI